MKGMIGYLSQHLLLQVSSLRKKLKTSRRSLEGSEIASTSNVPLSALSKFGDIIMETISIADRTIVEDGGPNLKFHMMMQHEQTLYAPKYVFNTNITLLKAMGIVYRIYLGVGVTQGHHGLHLLCFETHNRQSEKLMNRYVLLFFLFLLSLCVV